MPATLRSVLPSARSLGLLLAATLVVGGSVATTPPAAEAAPAGATVVTLPSPDRPTPRDARVEGGEEAWVLSQEVDPAGRGTVAPATWFSASGETAPVVLDPQRHVDQTVVVGDRRVHYRVGSFDISSTSLGSGEYEELVPPSTTTPVAATGDGVVVETTTGLALVPWERPGQLLPITGGESLAPLEPRLGRWSSSPQEDAHGVLLMEQSRNGQQAALVLVDTEALRVRPITRGELELAALGDDAVAWVTGYDAGRTVHSVRRPRAGDADVAPADVLVRPATAVPPPTTPFYDAAQVVPVGDVLVVLPLTNPTDQDQSPRDLLVVGRDGSSEVLRRAATSVVAAGDGAVRVVSGATARGRALERVDARTGATAERLSLAPVPAPVWALAMDGRRLVVADQSGATHTTVRQHSLTGDGSGLLVGSGQALGLQTDRPSSCSASRPLSRCLLLAAGGGTTALATWGAVLVRDASGGVVSVPDPTDDGVYATVEGIDGPYLVDMYDEHRDAVLDLRSGARVPARADGDLLDGVLYGVSSLDRRVDAVDLATGRSDVLGPRCPDRRDGAVRAAGSWLLVCGQVVDRTGRHPSVQVSGGDVTLGDGFLVRRRDGYLEWAALAGSAATTSAALTWQRLGEVAEDGVPSATSRSGDLPSVAWVGRDGRVRVAAIPVPSSPLPPRPTGVVTAPAAPTGVRATAGDTTVSVRWDAPAAGVRAVRARGAGLPDAAVMTTDADGLGVQVTGLVNGRSAAVDVVSLNLAGESAPVRVTATPLSATPPAPRDVRLTIDPLSSRATVTWSWTAAPATMPLTGFRVSDAVGPDVVLPPDARRASFVIDASGVTGVTVTAETGHGSAYAQSNSVPVHGVDRTAPTAAVRALPAVTTGTAVTVGLSGKDDRRLDGYQLRWRRGDATTAQSLGGWEYPRAWSALRTGAVEAARLTPGWTYCFSAQSVDHAGNRSAWTAPACTTLPLDDRALAVASGSWTRATHSAFAAGTATRSRQTASVLTRTKVRTDEVTLVATSCPTCGRVRVKVGSTVVGEVDLRATTTTHRRLFRLPMARAAGGALSLQHLGGGDVVVDGGALRAY